MFVFSLLKRSITDLDQSVGGDAHLPELGQAKARITQSAKVYVFALEGWQ